LLLVLPRRRPTAHQLSRAAARSQGALELREDPEQGAVVAGLKKIEVQSAEKIFSLLREGNARRKVRSGGAGFRNFHLLLGQWAWVTSSWAYMTSTPAAVRAGNASSLHPPSGRYTRRVARRKRRSTGASGDTVGTRRHAVE
jgi:hypothetical protein